MGYVSSLEGNVMFFSFRPFHLISIHYSFCPIIPSSDGAGNFGATEPDSGEGFCWEDPLPETNIAHENPIFFR